MRCPFRQKRSLDDAVRFEIFCNAVGSGDYCVAKGLYSDAMDALHAADSVLLATLHSNRSVCSYQLGDHSAAMADGQAAIDLRPGWGRGYLRKSMALMAMGEAVAAEATAREGCERCPDDEALVELMADLQPHKKKHHPPPPPPTQPEQQDDEEQQQLVEEVSPIRAALEEIKKAGNGRNGRASPIDMDVGQADRLYGIRLISSGFGHAGVLDSCWLERLCMHWVLALFGVNLAFLALWHFFPRQIWWGIFICAC